MADSRLSPSGENHLEPPHPLTPQVALPSGGGGEWRERARGGSKLKQALRQAKVPKSQVPKSHAPVSRLSSAAQVSLATALFAK